MNEKNKFIFRQGFNELLEIECTFTEARKKGDELANKHGRIECLCYNEHRGRWEALTTYLGNRQAINCFGQKCIIDPDYRNMWTKD
jgi:hypothetical protein